MALQIGSPPKRFQSTWDTTEAGSSNNQVVLPLQSAGAYSFQIDWGDGTSNRHTITAYDQAEVTHTYDSTGVYEIRIIGGITGWVFNNGGDDDKIIEISQWGPLTMHNQIRAFKGCSNLKLTSTDALNLGSLNQMRDFFSDCNSLDSGGNLNSWDVSDQGNSDAFRACFNNCYNFDQDLGNWVVGGPMGGMFKNNYVFNNGGSPSISGWNTSGCSSLGGMFENAYVFNQPIGSWDTSAVTNAGYLFQKAYLFNQDLSNWDMSSATTMTRMFNNATGFNNAGATGIYNWDVSSCTNFAEIFTNADSFNQNIGGWTFGTGLDQTINFFRFFQNNNNFNNGGSSAISGWNTSRVTNMGSMFSSATSFNQPVDGWDVTGVTSMSAMFNTATSFNNGGSTGINNWRPSSCTSMSSMFQNTSFNQPIGDWDTSSVNNFYRMFRINSSFNQDIGNWDVSSVVGSPGSTNAFRQMFGSAFNNGGSSSISGWDVSNCRNFTAMFESASSFNQDIGAWTFDNSYVGTSVDSMFNGASAFNNGGSTGINNWDTSSCTNMGAMFHSTTFNQPIGNWDTSSVTSIHAMFYNADAFDQDLSNWTVTAITDAGNFMGSANGLSTTNYDRTLSGWSSQSVNNGVSISFGNSQYSTATGASYRSTLVSKGWTITDGGSV